MAVVQDVGLGYCTGRGPASDSLSAEPRAGGRGEGAGRARQRRAGQRLLPREAEQGTPGVGLYLRRARGAARAALCAANLPTC